MSEAPIRHTPEPMPRVGVDMPLGDDLDWKKEWFSLAAQRNKDVSVLLNALASEMPYRPNVEGQDFYELCQAYRWAKEVPPVLSMPTVTQAFESLKRYIKTGELPWPSYEEPK